MPLPAGPSIALDTACSSSLLALQSAYQAICVGQCSAAIVGGINLLLKPNTSVQFMKLGMLSTEGFCKSFDAGGEGAGHGQGGRGPQSSAHQCQTLNSAKSRARHTATQSS